MDLLTSSPSHSFELQLPSQHTSAANAPGISENAHSNLISFCSPLMESEGFLKPKAKTQHLKPCDLVLQAATSPSDLIGLTSTPFEGDTHIPCFKFENQLVDIVEDPFDVVERKAVQFINNDPFEVTSAAAAAYTSDTQSVNSSNSMNCAFYDSSTGLTADFEKLGINSGNIPEDPPCLEEETPPTKSNVHNDDEEWLSNENPPWDDKQDSFEDARDDADEAEVFNVVKRVSSDFPNLIASMADELDTSIISKMKLRSPLLKTSFEDDESPPIEPLKVPSGSLRSVDLTFLSADCGSSAEMMTPVKQAEEDNLHE